MSSTAQNLTLLTDLYELTMMQGYFKNPVQETVIFDAFYRVNPCGNGYAIAAGLEQVIDYIKNLRFSEEDVEYLGSLGIFEKDFLDYLKDFRFSGDIYAIPEGTVVFPREPLIKVIAPIMEAQLVETAILNIINHQSLIATKAARVVNAARGDGVMEFGLRRAQGPDAGTYGARAAMIGGCIGTSNVLCGQLFDVPVLGTHAHSWIMSFPDEYTAFKTYAELYPNACTLLVDTYNVLRHGVPDAIKVFDEVLKPMGKRPKGIRIDSGDIAYLSKKARRMLDEAGYPDCPICASNSLDEYLVRDLILQGARVDSFGIGENMITAKSDPVFGGVYKLVAVEGENGQLEPRIKLSETAEKITTPNKKMVYRLYKKDDHESVADYIAMFDEDVPPEGPITLFDPVNTWKSKTFEDVEIKPLLVQVFKDGECIYDLPDIEEIKAYCRDQVDHLWEEVKRFENPHRYYVDLSEKLWHSKRELLKAYQG